MLRSGVEYSGAVPSVTYWFLMFLSVSECFLVLRRVAKCFFMLRSDS